MTQIDYKELKKGGFMKQIQQDHFSFRLRVVGGQIPADQLKKLYEVAEKFGQGYVHLTSRQSIEIPFVKIEDIDEIKRELAKAGIQPGACGPRVRTITACQGNAICPHGLIETTGLAKEFDRRYYARDLPHKLKIGITGCRNNCLKAEENDIGIKGGMKTEWQQNKCTFCGLCEAICPQNAITIQKEEQVLTFNESKCNYCGKCVKSCPVEAWKGNNGFIVYFGGLYGSRISIGEQLIPLLFSQDELYRVVEATIEFFEKKGKRGERFKDTLDRIGREEFKRELEGIL